MNKQIAFNFFKAGYFAGNVKVRIAKDSKLMEKIITDDFEKAWTKGERKKWLEGEILRTQNAYLAPDQHIYSMGTELTPAQEKLMEDAAEVMHPEDWAYMTQCLKDLNEIDK